MPARFGGESESWLMAEPEGTASDRSLSTDPSNLSILRVCASTWSKMFTESPTPFCMAPWRELVLQMTEVKRLRG